MTLTAPLPPLSYPTQTKLEVRQERFLSDPEAKSADDSPFDYRWDIPLTHITDRSQREQVWFDKDMDKGKTKEKQKDSKIGFGVEGTRERRGS